MTSFRFLTASAACLLTLSACSATIAPPYGNDAPMPTQNQSAQARSSKAQPAAQKKVIPKKATKTAIDQKAWDGDCAPKGQCTRLERTCEIAGTLCFFPDSGPKGSCLTIEQRKNCSGGAGQ